MYKIKKEIKDSFTIAEMLSRDSLTALNKIFGTYYTKDNIKKNIKVEQAPKEFKFWDRLMRQGSRSRI